MPASTSVAVQHCFHGGAFFDAVGAEFDDLSRRLRVVNADVLDAWFPPSPRVLSALREHLPWLLATSPPVDCGGMARVVARVRGVADDCVLPGSGSSALIFLALTRWLNADSRVLLLDPTYGEYQHVLQHVIGCRVHRLTLSPGDGYRLDPGRLADSLRQNYDLVVLVNPNSPTGSHVPRDELIAALRFVPSGTRVWIDETYVDYVGEQQSLESFAASHPAVIVCKSMSKVYALSGARAAYLCASARQLQALRPFVPPWAVSLPAQVAAVEAVLDPTYYAARYRETHRLRGELTAALARLPGVRPLPGAANFVFCHLDRDRPTAAEVVSRCHARGVFLRDVMGMGTTLGAHAIRIAVKDGDAIGRIIAALREALRDGTLPAAAGGAATVA